MKKLMENKPKTDVTVLLSDKNKNVFNLCNIVVNSLKINGYLLEAKQVSERLTGLYSYDEAIHLFSEYVYVK